MNIKFITSTNVYNTILHIAEVAGMCYNKTDKSDKTDEQVLEFVKGLFIKKHYSPFEFIDYEIEVEGISRVALAQITRHRSAHFMVKSGRYCKETAPEFYLPSSLSGNKTIITCCSFRDDNYDDIELDADIDDLFYKCEKMYNELIKSGIKTEDARYILPQALTTSMRFKFNLKDWLCSIYPQRASSKAQEEVRNIVMAIDICLQESSHSMFKEFMTWYHDGGNKAVLR